MDKNYDLAIKLATSETEEDVICLLKNEGYWDNYACWKAFGDVKNNYSIIGNQQSDPEAALVEKIINSADACLIKECLVRGIDPESDKAPKTMEKAIKKFYNVSNGDFMELVGSKRSELAEEIILAATGKKTQLNLTLVDKGEGQTPKKIPETIMSLNRSNKIKIPFVQGKFNMGGTGVLPFCGENRFQLVISKRCPSIPNTTNDETFDCWSVSIVRREPPRNNEKSSRYTYLTDENGNLLTFKAESLPIIPNYKSLGFMCDDMYYGTYFKFYDYEIKAKSTIVLGLNYHLSYLIPKAAHPVRIRECREDVVKEAKQRLAIFYGLSVRLSENSDKIENGFPVGGALRVDGQKITYNVYAFKKSENNTLIGKDKILYTVNGQTHFSNDKRFFNQMKLDYVKDDVLIIVDCSELDAKHYEDSFMNSRDRMRINDFSEKVDEAIKNCVRKDENLKRLNNKRHHEQTTKKVEDNEQFKNVLQKVCNKFPVFAKILKNGEKISNPFDNRKSAGETTKYEGKLHPTYFNLKKGKNVDELVKEAPINSDFRVQFLTDAENGYFTRLKERGELEIYIEDLDLSPMNYRLNLLNGTATLTLSHPDNVSVGDEYKVHTKIVDDYCERAYLFESSFKVKVTEAKENSPNKSQKNENKSARDSKKKGNEDDVSGLSMPALEEVGKEQWNEYEMDENSALVVRSSDEGSTYYINVENRYLLDELRSIKDKNDSALKKQQYENAMTMLGMMIESHYRNSSKELNDEIDVSDKVREITSIISPVVIPLLLLGEDAK